jgi:hypothetical protein
MTVAELITKLTTLPHGANVYVGDQEVDDVKYNELTEDEKSPGVYFYILERL